MKPKSKNVHSICFLCHDFHYRFHKQQYEQSTFGFVFGNTVFVIGTCLAIIGLEFVSNIFALGLYTIPIHLCTGTSFAYVLGLAIIVLGFVKTFIFV